MIKVFLLIYFIIFLVSCDHGGKKRDERYSGRHRQGRLFSFNVVDEDISVDLEFSIPFLKIPVKKTIDSVHGLMDFPKININPAALALGGVVVIGSTLFLPYLLKHYASTQDYRYAKLLDNADFSADAMLDLTHQLVTNSQRFQGCPLRVICWVAQKDFANPQAIMEQMTNNKLLSSMVNSSSIGDAMIFGKEGRSCTRYGPCPLQEHQVPMLIKNLASFTNKPG